MQPQIEDIFAKTGIFQQKQGNLRPKNNFVKTANRRQSLSIHFWPNFGRTLIHVNLCTTILLSG